MRKFFSKMNFNVFIKFVYVKSIILFLNIPHTKSNEPNKLISMGQSILKLAYNANECGK